MEEHSMHDHAHASHTTGWWWECLLVVLLLLLGWWYHHAAKRAKSPSLRQRISFTLGLITYGVASVGPWVALTHTSFSIHMLQMSLHYFVTPPLIWIGLLHHPWFAHRTSQRFWQRCAIPIPAIFLFNALMALYHLPPVFDQIMRSPSLHFVAHGLLLLAGFHTAWTFLAPMAGHGGGVLFRRFAMLVANSILLMPTCMLIALSDNLLYADYRGEPLTWLVPTALADQQLGGTIMKLMQEVVYWSILGHIYWRWVRLEQAREEKENGGDYVGLVATDAGSDRSSGGPRGGGR